MVTAKWAVFYEPGQGSGFEETLIVTCQSKEDAEKAASMLDEKNMEAEPKGRYVVGEIIVEDHR